MNDGQGMTMITTGTKRRRRGFWMIYLIFEWDGYRGGGRDLKIRFRRNPFGDCERAKDWRPRSLNKISSKSFLAWFHIYNVV